MFIGHKREDGVVQPLADHLNGVAKLSAEFAKPFGGADHAYRTGLLHDIGKYAPDVQRRMEDPIRHKQKVNHTSAGAIEARNLKDLYAAFAIAGHHGGLANAGGRSSTPLDGTLMGKLKHVPQDYSGYKGEIALPNAEPPRLSAYAASMYVRMLFSCLVDADFLDTETFMHGCALERGKGEPLERLLDKLNGFIKNWFPPRGEINTMRCAILDDCLRGGEMKRGLYTLTVPTGGGKTVSSLAFALSHAKQHGMRRVIYVVPYMSIIEQNAAKFAQILGEENVLEHHSGVEFDEQTGDEELSAGIQRKRLATENWDAPLIVTTAVQFFESLYAAQTSRCRKLHNIANSVIIFDEAQMMPPSYLSPCVAAIAELVSRYGATAVLCTATQPSLDGLFRRHAPQLQISEIVSEPKRLYEFFRRVSFRQEGLLSDEELSDRLNGDEQTLCIVNTKKRAQQVYELLETEGRFHLSTFMTARDRRKALDAIRQRLKEGLPCRVVSTSLIEAGVDVDFPSVWREETGLDSILQAAGRCNREGKRDRGESFVHVFEAEDGYRADKRIQSLHYAMDSGEEIDSLPAIELYFRHLLHVMGEEVDQKRIVEDCERMNLRDVSDRFKLIESDTVTIYIPCEENEELLDQLRTGEYSRKTIHALQKDGVSVYRQQAIHLAGAGKIETTRDGFLILCDGMCYSSEKGLEISSDPGCAVFI